MPLSELYDERRCVVVTARLKEGGERGREGEGEGETYEGAVDGARERERERDM